MTSLQLTILITTIDEAKNLEQLVPEIHRAFAPDNVPYEILIIDGGSRDGTPEVARRLGCRVETQTARGYAQAIRDGIRMARGEWLLVMDADGSHSPADAHRLFELRHKSDIVINSRYIAGGGSETVFFRSLLSRFLNFAYRIALDLPYKEVSGGFRIYKKHILEEFELTSQFYEVQEELLIKPHWLGYRAIEIPYTYLERKNGVSKANLIVYGTHLLKAILHFRALKPTFIAEHPRPAPARKSRI